MLIGRKNLAKHRPWVGFVLIATAAATAWSLGASRGAADWPGGGSLPGLSFGVAGGLLILFEFALWGRKKLRAWRIGRVQTRMIAHVWLGLLTVPLLVSGVWGLALQQFLPTRMLDQVPAEMIHSQIGRMVGFMVADAHRLVAATCGPAPGEDSHEAEPEDVEHGVPISHLTVGAVQTVGDIQGDIQGKVLVTRVPGAAVPGSEPLRELFRSSIAPYPIRGRASRSPLTIPNKARAIFDDLRARLGPATHETVQILENLCDQRRQLDLQDRLHRRLHNWLAVHLPLSVAVVVLMFAHARVALKYR